VRPDHGVDVDRRSGLALDELGGVPRLEQVHALVVGEEHLGDVEPGRRGERAAAGRARVVGEGQRVGGVVRDREVPVIPAAEVSTSIFSRSDSGIGSCSER
jgi:hypothetical protein